MKKNFRNALVLLIAIAALIPACKPSASAVESALKDYLEKNPQYLEKKIEEAMKKRGMAQRAPEPPLEERIKNAIPVDLNNAPVKGSPNAVITIVEFSDFQCPFCSRVVPTAEKILKEYEGKVRFAFRNNPLPFHKDAMPAAKAALAANEQGKFWAMHDALFAGQKDLSEAAILGMAKKIGLNAAKFKADWKSTKFDKQIQDDIEFAKKTGATGTPAFFINGVALKGARPFESFKEVIDKLLEQKAGPAPAAVPAPTPAPNKS